MSDLFINRGAIFSECQQYRYRLWRIWDESKPAVTFLMLNPSTADEIENDPTVERCERRARIMGYGGLQVVNIFALRSTDPNALYTHAEPVGKGNDEAIVAACHDAGVVICAWGSHGKYVGRGEQVAEMLTRDGIDLHYLKLNANGTPMHPLYVGYNELPKPWRWSA